MASTVIMNKPVKVAESTVEVSLPVEAREALSALARARYEKREAEKAEKAAKTALASFLPESVPDVKMVLSVEGMILGSLQQIITNTTDRALLEAAYPEAFEATNKASHYDKITTA